MLNRVEDESLVQGRGMGNWAGLRKIARGMLRYSCVFFFIKGMFWLALIAFPFVA